ncbi:hypothetical protein BHM03_00006072 [Ensete ventricosum]|nr:hypothetical protein BHM03_00006072 [Ensete ventricosum]
MMNSWNDMISLLPLQEFMPLTSVQGKLCASAPCCIFYVDSFHAACILHQVPPKFLRSSICIELIVALAPTIPWSSLAGTRKTVPVSNGPGGMDTIAGLLASLLEVVRTTVACECVYVRAMVIKALIWMQNPHESLEELQSIIACELSDPAWPSALLNDILLTLHARFKVLLYSLNFSYLCLSYNFDYLLIYQATPDMAVTLLEIARIFATKVPGKIDADVLQLLWKVAGPEGKHTALEAVTIVLDLPPPHPGSMLGLTSVDRVSASDPKSALALQRLVQAAVWFLGENANYAASEYAWESATPPGTALMMLDADKMVAAASSRNPTLAGALTRLQRCAFSGSWELYIFLPLCLLTVLASRDMRNHDNNKQEWTDEELKKLYETHEKLLNLVSLFCYVPRAKYLPLGPTSMALCKNLGVKNLSGNVFVACSPIQVNEFLAGAGTDAPDVEEEENITSRPSVTYDDLWAKSILETYEAEVREEPPSYSSSVLQRFESLENPLAGRGGQSFGSQDEDAGSQNPQFGKALYDFTAGGDDELSLTAGEEVEIDYEVDGWYYVSSRGPSLED